MRIALSLAWTERKAPEFSDGTGSAGWARLAQKRIVLEHTIHVEDRWPLDSISIEPCITQHDIRRHYVCFEK